MQELVLGTAQLGLAYGRNNDTGHLSQDAAFALLDAAWNAGIRQFDTARAYGDSEARLGRYFAARPAHKPEARIVTKLRLSDEAWNLRGAALTAWVGGELARSRAALGQTTLSVLLLHQAAAATIDGGRVWATLCEEKARGGIDTLGLSLQTPEEWPTDWSDIGHIQLPYNLLDWRWDAVMEAKPAYVVLHARSVFLQGTLTGAQTAIPGYDSNRALHAALEALRLKYAYPTRAGLCLAFAKATPAIDGIVLGMETLEQLAANHALWQLPSLLEGSRSAIRKALPRLDVAHLNPALWPAKDAA